MGDLTIDGTEVGRKRLKQLFQYLEAFNQQRNPVVRQVEDQPWALWLKNLPQHPSIRRGGGEDEMEQFVLKIRRPVLKNAPEPPNEIREWIRPGWDDCFKEVEFEKVAFIDFADMDPKRERVLDHWIEARDKWAELERPAKEAYKVFERIYAMYNRIEREAGLLELVFGDGILSWRLPDGGLYHPILLQRLQLSFEPTIPEFTFQETVQPVEFYTALLRTNPNVDPKVIARVREEIERENYHPLDGERTSEFLKGLVQSLSSNGQFIPEGGVKGEADFPRLARDPLIFLRAGNLGFAKAIEAVLKEIPNLELMEIPQSLLNLTGTGNQPQMSTGSVASNINGGGNEDEDTLFSKPANQEQLLIAQRLEQHGCVLVQGPPGTGKTHTIANLIGHLLAQGKSVLVTSHTTKALRVLRGQIDAHIRSLCVSVLDSDTESQHQLSAAIGQISEMLNKDASVLEKGATQLRKSRAGIIAKLRELREKLRQARADEYRDLIIGGASYSPARAARIVQEGNGKDDWIPHPVNLGCELPLSETEVAELYTTNLIISPEDETDLALSLPEPELLMPSHEFDSLVEELSDLKSTNFVGRDELWESSDSVTVSMLEELLMKLDRAVEPIANGVNDLLRLTLIDDGRRGIEYSKVWEELIEKIDQVVKTAAAARSQIMQIGPKPAAGIPFEQQNRILDEIINHLKRGASLGKLTLLVHPRWRYLVEKASVDDRRPTELIHFLALNEAVNLEIQRAGLISRWDRQMNPLGAPSAVSFKHHPEEICQQYATQMQRLIAWHDRVWSPLEVSLRETGFLWDDFLQEIPLNPQPHGDLFRLAEGVRDHLPPIMRAKIVGLRRSEIEQEFLVYRSRIKAKMNSGSSTKLLCALLLAIESKDIVLHRGTCERIAELHHRHRVYLRRKDLLGQLKTAAPGWAEEIRQRNHRHSNGKSPGDPQRAWLWRQFNSELEERARVSIDQLQKEIERLVSDLHRVTTELIETSSWAHQIRRTGLEQKQALSGWLQTMKKVGAGKGKGVPLLLAEARKLMQKCRSAVPVWIMPLARVVENYQPQKGLFDVVIIDEASQCDVMGLIALYLGKKVIVVGDHEQVSPVAVGKKFDDAQSLINIYLQGIPNAHLFDGKLSIYDLAMQSFSGTICLLEHFRCVPEIIQFSNGLSYDWKIKPLRDSTDNKIAPPVISYRVCNGSSDSKINTEEARTVAAFIAAAAEQPEYAKQTFGVISMVGDEQAEEIEKILRSKISPAEFTDRQIICGNSAQFQGDERDVMFLSVIDGPGDGPLRMRREDLYKKRFNVAASRARNQLWVVHSLQPEVDLQPGDLRRRLIDYAQNPLAQIQAHEQQLSRTESEFERQVMKILMDAGFLVTPQWNVGAYRIDMVVSGHGRRLAVECDGDRWHPVEQIPEDMQRQAILERLGWRFIRIRGSEFFRNPEKAMEPVFDRLENMGIKPEGAIYVVEQRREELAERVIRRGEQLLTEWFGVNIGPDKTVKDSTDDSDDVLEPFPKSINFDETLEHEVLELN
jgi:very-short-patch-repair endonuclease/Cdc6-like AAA superfamily ATPase